MGTSKWSLSHFVILVLIGAFALLLLEVRYLHQPVLGEHAIAWTPIAYSGMMTLASAAGLIFWNLGGRRVLFWLFAPAIFIGPIGCWYHNGGRPLQGLKHELDAWTRPVGHEHAHAAVKESDQGAHSSAAGSAHPTSAKPRGEQVIEADGSEGGSESADDSSGEPPPSAPLAITGLGILGMLACARRLQPGPTSSPDGA